MPVGRGEAATLLRIYLSEPDKVDGSPLFETIIARDSGMEGATVLRGVESFGAGHRLHSGKVLRLAAELPIAIEIVDSAESIERFLDILDPLIERSGTGGLVTLENVRAMRYPKPPGSEPGLPFQAVLLA